MVLIFISLWTKNAEQLFMYLLFQNLLGWNKDPENNGVRSPEGKTPPNWRVDFLFYPFCFYAVIPGTKGELEAILGSHGRGDSGQPAWLWSSQHIYCSLLLCSLEHLEKPPSQGWGLPSCQFCKSFYRLPVGWGNITDSWLMESEGKVQTQLQAHKILLRNPPLSFSVWRLLIDCWPPRKPRVEWWSYLRPGHIYGCMKQSSPTPIPTHIPIPLRNSHLGLYMYNK